MKLWCIHTRNKVTGEIVKAQMRGPDDAQFMFRFAERALANHPIAGEFFEVDLVHEEVPAGEVAIILPYFSTAIENMVFQGLTVVRALVFAAHFIIHKQKESGS